LNAIQCETLIKYETRPFVAKKTASERQYLKTHLNYPNINKSKEFFFWGGESRRTQIHPAVGKKTVFKKNPENVLSQMLRRPDLLHIEPHQAARSGGGGSPSDLIPA
jgi:hypothetical protein